VKHLPVSPFAFFNIQTTLNCDILAPLVVYLNSASLRLSLLILYQLLLLQLFLLKGAMAVQEVFYPILGSVRAEIIINSIIVSIGTYINSPPFLRLGKDSNRIEHLRALY
jgi:hypothetical protein